MENTKLNLAAAIDNEERKTLGRASDEIFKIKEDLKKASLLHGDIVETYDFPDGIEAISASNGKNAFKWNYDYDRIITQLDIVADYLYEAIKKVDELEKLIKAQ